MLKRFKKADWVLILILSIAFVMRMYRIDENPPSLNWDEVSHGYNAYSILKTGKDEWGNVPILNFRAYGDYPMPLNLYTTIPFIWVFGLSDFSIRFPHVIFGSFLILPVYYLAYGLTRKRSLALLSAFLSAMTPWYIFLSRFVLQSNLSVFFLTASLAVFFNREKCKYRIPLSMLLFILTLFSYHTTRIFTPLALLLLGFLYGNNIIGELKKRRLLTALSLAFLTAFILIFFTIAINPDSKARSKWVFIINDGTVAQIIEKRQNSDLPDVLDRLLYNRLTYFATAFSENYFGYFSPKYLFFEGGTNYQFSVPGKGLLHLVNLPFYYVGLAVVAFFALKRKKEYQFIFLYLLLSPIPAALTSERYAVIRSTAVFPFNEIVISIGLFWIMSKIFPKSKVCIKKKVAFFTAYIFLIIFGSYRYLNYYFKDYRNNYSWVWQYGYKEAVNYANDHYRAYDKIIFTKKYGEPHEFVLFYTKWSSEKYRSDNNLIRFEQSDWFWVDRFDKFYFVNDWDVPKEEWQPFVLESGEEELDCREIKCLLVTSPGNVPKTWSKLETINLLDGTPAFEIYEN